MRSIRTRNGRFPWAAVLVILGCSTSAREDPTPPAVDLAGRARGAVPEASDAGGDVGQLEQLRDVGADLGADIGLGADVGQLEQLRDAGADLGTDGADLPRSITGKPYPACPPIVGAEACGNAGRPELAYGRTRDGFVCASCAPSVAVPCWIDPPLERGPYGLCKRPWLCVPVCSRDCADLHGPTCATVP